MTQPACSRAIRRFYQTTTLHGFKYLCSKYYYDRVGWLACCCASACCAGVLCAVLWARFLQVPALLTLHDLRARHADVRMPLVAVCPPAEAVADYFQKHLSIPSNLSDDLPAILGHVLQRRFASKEQLALLEDLLQINNLTLPRALMKVMPPCHEIIINCRWLSKMMPCDQIFLRQLTEWGVCCISNLDKRPKTIKVRSTRLDLTRQMHIAMQCSDKFGLNGCQFFTKYDGEDWVEPVPLTPGFNYLAQTTFTSVVDRDPDKLVDGTCISREGYLRSQCLLRCKEKFCGCSDPLRAIQRTERDVPPPCSVTEMNCLRTFKNDNYSCKCLPTCKKVSTCMALESSRMNAIEDTIDQVYYGLNVSVSSVLRITVRIGASRVFVVNPTETWITLLSSLGGVFNMFLGVGLFSALEVLFLFFVRLPIAIRKSSEMENTSEIGNQY